MAGMRIERRGVGDQRVAQVFGKGMHHAAGYSSAAHRATLPGIATMYERSA